jgi:GTPase SAR1 family protein
VVGKSGMGKSTSLRNLNPEETFIVNTDQKPLPFKKFSEKYNEEKGNYLKSSDTNQILATLKEIHKNPKIKTAVIDTWSRIMTDFVMAGAFRKNSGFEKWATLSGSQYDLINIINHKMREDLVVYLFAHPETIYDEDGFPNERIAVQGKQLEKMAPESFSTIVLYAEIEKNPQGNKHLFRTKSSGNDTCKTPIDMFESDVIDNDLTLVNQAIKDYY